MRKNGNSENAFHRRVKKFLYPQNAPKSAFDRYSINAEKSNEQKIKNSNPVSPLSNSKLGEKRIIEPLP